jgi:hypothetical protein
MTEKGKRNACNDQEKTLVIFTLSPYKAQFHIIIKQCKLST